jgi:hypothetical protein
VDWSFPSYRQAQGNGISCAAPGMKARKQASYTGPYDGARLHVEHTQFSIYVYKRFKMAQKGSFKLVSKRNL